MRGSGVRADAWRVYLVAGLALALASLLSPDGARSVIKAVVAIGVAAATAWRIRRTPGMVRAPWLLLASGGLVALLSGVVRAAHGALSAVDYPYPSPADALAVPGYVLIMMGGMELGRRRGARWDHDDSFDAAIVATATGVLFFAGLLSSYLRDAAIPAPERVGTAVYSVLTILFVGMLARLAVAPGTRNPSWTLLASATACAVINDVLLTLDTTGVSGAATLAAAVGPAALVFVGSSVLHPTAVHITDAPAEVEPTLSRLRIGLLGAALSILPIVLLVSVVRGTEPDLPVLVVGSIFLAGLSLVRLRRLFRAKERVLADERVLRSASASLLPALDRDQILHEVSYRLCELVDGGTGQFGVVISADTDDESPSLFDAGPFAAAPASGVIRRRWLEVVAEERQVEVPLDRGSREKVLLTGVPDTGRGLVTLATGPAGEIDGRGRRTLLALADQVSVAIRAADLREELVRQRSERRFRRLVENSSDVVYIIDDTAQVRFASPAIMSVLGYTEEEAVGTDLRSLATDSHQSTLERFIQGALHSARLGPIELQVRRSDGIVRWFEMLSRDHRADPVIGGVVITARDITDRKSADDRLARSEARFRSLVQHSSDVIAVVDGSGFISYVTPSVTGVLGYRPDSLVGTSVYELIHVDSQSLVSDELARLGDPFTRRDLEMEVRGVSGRYRTLAVTLTDLRDEPAVMGIVVNARDVTVRKTLERDLEHQSLHDGLTGLANRAGFVRHLQGALDEPLPGELAVLIMDLDDFKTVNDSLGHTTGDEILCVIADRLRTSLRLSDHAARLGGDEFAVLLRDHGTPIDTDHVASRLLDDLSAPVTISGHEVSLTVSIGIAIPIGERSADELMRDADAAMYRAKDSGKARFERFEEHIRTDLFERLELRNELRRGISNGELLLYYQPVVSLQTDRISGAEALVRWRHPTRGILAPGAFIPLAEESGLIDRLGQWVFEKACEQLMAWNSQKRLDEPLTMSINLSARQLESDESVDALCNAAERLDVPRGLVILELTESVLIEEFANHARLSRLHAFGFQLAVDDFGTGYSGLAYLQAHPFDIIKIDRHFVTGVDTNMNRAAFLARMLELARGVGAHTVAEGVEGGGELEELRRLGFDYGQGYYFSHPVPADVFEQLIGAEQYSI